MAGETGGEGCATVGGRSDLQRPLVRQNHLEGNKKPQSQSGIHLLVLDMTNHRFENVGQSVLRDGWATVVDLQNNLVPPTQSDQGNWVIGAPVLSAAYR